MKTLSSVTGGLAAGSTIMAVAWCYGLNLTDRGINLGSAVLVSLLIAFAAACAINERK
jgi:hypothetical protein